MTSTQAVLRKETLVKVIMVVRIERVQGETGCEGSCSPWVNSDK